MAHPLQELALFPLHAVLLPHTEMHLNVFEERYLRMVRKCIDQNLPFGVALIREGGETGDAAEPYLVGTTARILTVEERPDGTLGLVIVGEGRFRIRGLDDAEGYLVGLVEPVYEHPMRDPDEGRRLFESVREEFDALVKRLFGRQDFAVHVRFPTDPTILSFTVANLLPMANLDRQRMLETTDTIDRMQSLQPILRGHLLEADTTQTLIPCDPEELRSHQSPN